MIVNEILDSIKKLTVVELNHLADLMKDEFGLLDSVASAPAENTESDSASKTYKLLIKSIGSNKVSAMKIIKEIKSCSLQEAKAAVENLSTPLFDQLGKEDIDSEVAKFKSADYKELELEVVEC